VYKVNVNSKSGYSFRVKAANYAFDVDASGKAITPPDTLLAGLGTCIGVYIRKYAEGAKLDLGEFDINVEADFSSEKPVSFKKIKVNIDLKNVRLEDKRKNALLAFVKNCPVSNTLKANPDIDVRIL